MIESINATLDIYSHLRVDVALRDAPRTRTDAGRRERNVTPQTATDSDPQARRAPLQIEDDEVQRNVVRFAQSSLAGDATDSAVAEEMQPALEASVLPSDPRMATVARLYQRNGRTQAGREETIGTRLDAYA